MAVIGAGPGGLTAAKHSIEAGFDVTVFEASDDLGGQWHTTAAHSGIWPGMRTNTSRAMTAFSDHPPPSTHDLHPFAEQIHAYLRSYADAFGVTERIRFGTTVELGPSRMGRRRRIVRRGHRRVRTVPRPGAVRRPSTGSAASCCTPTTIRGPTTSPAVASSSTATA